MLLDSIQERFSDEGDDVFSVTPRALQMIVDARHIVILTEPEVYFA